MRNGRVLTIIGRATAKLVVTVNMAVIEQACPVLLSAAVWDLHATMKWQYQTFWKTDEKTVWIFGLQLIFMKFTT